MDHRASEGEIGKKEEGKILSMSPIPPKNRGGFAYSTHSILPQKKKILPQGKLKDGKRCESSHVQKKSNEKTTLRYRKLDLTVGEGLLGGNPLKDFKRKTLRGRVR